MEVVAERGANVKPIGRWCKWMVVTLCEDHYHNVFIMQLIFIYNYRQHYRDFHFKIQTLQSCKASIKVFTLIIFSVADSGLNYTSAYYNYIVTTYLDWKMLILRVHLHLFLLSFAVPVGSLFTDHKICCH